MCDPRNRGSRNGDRRKFSSMVVRDGNNSDDCSMDEGSRRSNYPCPQDHRAAFCDDSKTVQRKSSERSGCSINHKFCKSKKKKRAGSCLPPNVALIAASYLMNRASIAPSESKEFTPCTKCTCENQRPSCSEKKSCTCDNGNKNETLSINLERSSRLCMELRPSVSNQNEKQKEIPSSTLCQNQNKDIDGVRNSLDECRAKERIQSDTCQGKVCVCASSETSPKAGCLPTHKMEDCVGFGEVFNQKSKCDDAETLSPEQWRNIQYHELARDNYCPGTIQDAAESNLNYNAMALKLMKETFGQIPKAPGCYTPYSLLEIFQCRIKTERSNLKYFLGDSNDNYNSNIDVYFQQKIHNETNRAISSLFKAEKSHEATVPPEPLTINLNITSNSISMSDCGEAVSYMGLITPR